MSLPSRYAPEGISDRDAHRTITSGKPRPKKPINFTIRTIETRINNAVNHQHNQHHQNHYDYQHHHHNNQYDNFRNGVDEDIEMVGMDDYKEVDVISEFVSFTRNSGDLIYSDVMEGIEQQVTDVEVIKGNISYLILDTNFILSHLDIINDLTKLSDEYGLRIIVPITVIQELDGLKKSNRYVSDSEDRISSKSVGHLARWANDWIFSMFSKNSAIIRGQKLRERLDKTALQDDAILDCCLYWKQEHPKSLIVLFSNDKNFCMKALANDVLTVSYRKQMTAELVAKVIYNENVNRFGKIKEETVHRTKIKVHQPEVVVPQEPSDEWKDATKQVQNFSSFDEVADRVHTEIQTITLSAIHHCMENEYGEDLELLREYDRDSVITLYDCAQVFIRFWFTVFQTYFKASIDNFTPFEETGRGKKSVKTPIFVDIPRTPVELNAFIKFWSAILTTIYQSQMSEVEIKALDHLIKRWENMSTLF
ncbi:PIN domain-containing protein [Scheffersomyces coipomensis]|uniref:PIN domain-containing protein n=1 Tax=Scheffersomyces coipomensis TaxID=1788519 RepID=UPI00315CD63A